MTKSIFSSLDLKKKRKISIRALTILITVVITLLISAKPGYGQNKSLVEIPAIDFSYAGFGGGGKTLPAPPGVIAVKSTGKDDFRLLQAAIDYVSKLPLQENGFRGAINLGPGKFFCSQTLSISASGVVLRGSGTQKTIIVATGKDRHPLIEVGKKKNPGTTNKLRILDPIVPAGSMIIKLESIEGLKEGDRMVISRPSTKKWITALGMDTLEGNFADLRFYWPEGSRNLVWDRTIVSIDEDNNQIEIDAPITTAIEQIYGGGTVENLAVNLPAGHIGIENLVIESEFDKENLKDEEHAWYGIVLNNLEDSWVRDVTARYFVSSAVRVGPRARRISLLNCRSEFPVSEIGGYRRFSFLVEGQQVLVENCTADSGINDFAIGFLAAGPNVFLNCKATKALGASGSYESWASGVLYEGVEIEGGDLRLTYDMKRAQAGGWTAANSVIWNCTADEIVAKGPKGAPVVVVESNKPLYKNQLLKRRGTRIDASTKSIPLNTAVEESIKEFTVKDFPASSPATEKALIKLKIVNGRFVTGNDISWGGAVNDAWWLGQTSPANALDAGISITRFVPGREGPGLTEDLPKLIDQMASRNIPFYQSGPAIWYDRRRDDHTIAERSDGNVWAAFYELPWARSGKGKAWDGLSKYDLETYNHWYFERTKAFASLADEHSVILYHHLYNNHNLLETAAHWVDSPWRPKNNINKTNLPEPPPLEPGNKIHISDQFYDINNEALIKLHRAYILHVLDQLGHFENVIFGLSFQYSGPLSFQQFFHKTVAEWEKKNGREVRLVLDTGKNITDAILNDAKFSKQVAVIDMRYWHYLPDGSLWAPSAGQNRAFRELHPKEFGDPTGPEQIYRQVRDYHEKYPDKAIVSWHSGVNPVATLMAGGAQVLMRNPTAGHGQGREIDRHPIDVFVREKLAEHLMYMEPVDRILKNGDRNWVLADNNHTIALLYSLAGKEIVFMQSLNEQKFKGIWFNPESGDLKDAVLPGVIKNGTSLQKPSEENWLLLLHSL